MTAVVTRSILAAVIVPIVIGVAQFFIRAQLDRAEQVSPSALHLLEVPGLAASQLEGFCRGMGIAAPAAGLAFAALAAWIVGALAAALMLFERQDLGRE